MEIYLFLIKKKYIKHENSLFNELNIFKRLDDDKFFSRFDKNEEFANSENKFYEFFKSIYSQLFESCTVNFLEIYKNIFNYIKLFLYPDNILSRKISFNKSFQIINNIIYFLETINFQIDLQDNIKEKTLIHINNYICSILLKSLTEILNILNPINSSILFDETQKCLDRILNFSQSDDILFQLEIIKNYLLSNYSEFLGSHNLQIKINNPKNNFNYVQTKERSGLKFPFYLQVNVKLKNILIFSKLTNSYSEVTREKKLPSLDFIKIAKNLFITVCCLNQSKRVEIDPSSIKINLIENSITIKSKVPLYINELEMGEYSISVHIKSIFKKELSTILKRLNFNIYNNYTSGSQACSISSQFCDMIPITSKLNFVITY